MNSFQINGAGINGAGSFASIVYIPDAVVTVELALNERNAVTLSGAIETGLVLLGDISRVSNLGTAEATFQFDPTGLMAIVILGPAGSIEIDTLLEGTMDPAMYMAGSIEVSTVLSSNLVKVAYLGYSDLDHSLEPTGILTFTGGLAGVVDQLLNPSGSLTVGIVNILPFAPAFIEANATGKLRATYMLSGNSDMTTALESDFMSTTIRMPLCNIPYYLDIQGNLANNAYTPELSASTMIRRKTVREMTR